MERETVMEVQADVADVLSQLRSALADLECAEGCETGADLRANLSEALATLSVTRDECRKLVKRAMVARDE